MQKHWWLALAALIVLVAAFALIVPHATEPSKRQATPAASSTPSIYVHDAYKKGTHTLAIAISAPNPCTSVDANASVVPGASSSTPDTIIIAVDMPLDTGICLQEPATTTLTLTAAASSDAAIEANINGSSTPVVSD